MVQAVFCRPVISETSHCFTERVIVSYSNVSVDCCVQAMFTCGLKETRGGEVPLRDTPSHNLELLLNYMYRAELPLSNENIQGVAAAAFLLHVDGAFR